MFPEKGKTVTSCMYNAYWHFCQEDTEGWVAMEEDGDDADCPCF